MDHASMLLMHQITSGTLGYQPFVTVHKGLGAQDYKSRAYVASSKQNMHNQSCNTTDDEMFFLFCFVFFSGQTLIHGVNESEILLDHAAAYTLMHIYFAKFQCIHRYLMKCVPINSVLRIAGSILQLMPTLQTYLNAGLSELCIAS